MKSWFLSIAAGICLVGITIPIQAQLPGAGDTKQAEKKDPVKEADEKAAKAQEKGDSAWMLVSTALVMLMVPGLALFYGGMVRRKNILGTMMQSMVALSVVGVFWIAIGFSLAFGEPWLQFGDRGSVLGFSKKLVFLQGVNPQDPLPGTNIPVYLYMLFQGMFAIITPALISGAIAERIRFLPYCVFLIIWSVVVYCPLAHCVWALDWWTGAESAGTNPVGVLGKLQALDFAGGTVVHIAAGFSSLAAILVLRRRLGYPETSFHPSSMVLTLTGAGLLWFGWFGFNGGSAVASGAPATSAFAATQAAAAAAGLSWLLAEGLHRGKPTALGLASGIVAGLVAVTPASGFVTVTGGLIIGLIAGVVCYVSVNLKAVFKYDDSLDAFGVHGVGGFLGAVLTGVFCYQWTYLDPPVGQNGLWVSGDFKQVGIQFIAALASAALAFFASLIIVKLVDLALGFVTDADDEILGLDRTEHGETGFDFGLAMEAAAVSAPAVPRPAMVPPNGKRFAVVLEGVKDNGELIHTWSELCQPGQRPAEFKAVYPYVTTVQGSRFTFRGGDPETMRTNLQKLMQALLKTPVKAKVETH